MRHSVLTTAVTLGFAVSALSALTLVPAFAQDAAPGTNAAGPGPATAPPPPPGTTTPAPTQPSAAPTPPGTVTEPGAAAPAAPAAPPPNYKIQYNGLIDGYIQYQANNPHGTLLDSATNVGNFSNGAYNARIKTPTLQLAELNVFNTPKPGGFAFKTTLIAGDIADQNHLNFNFQTGGSNGSTGEAQFKNIQQLYGTYAFAGAGGGVDVGKFYTPFGYEVTEANGDYNYTRSLAYNILPFYHAGVRVYSPSYNGLVVTGWVVNDMYNTTTEGVHHQGDYAYIGQLNYTDPKGKFTAISSLGFGKDLLAGVKTKDTVSDTDFTYNLNANQLFGLNYDFVTFNPDGDIPGGDKTKQMGYAVYYRQALTPKTAVAARFSGIQTKFDSGIQPAGLPDKIRPYEVTVTYEYKPATNFTTRLEYRHDSTNVDGTYLGKNDFATVGGSKKNEDLLLLAGLFSF